MAVLRLAEPIDFYIAVFDLFHGATISGLLSRMGQINQVCLFIWNGQRAGESENTRGKERKKGVGWRREAEGEEGVNVVRVILLLEHFALTATEAWEPNQSISIHSESGFMWADSGTVLHESAGVTWTLLPLNTTACSSQFKRVGITLFVVYMFILVHIYLCMYTHCMHVQVI